MQPIRESQWDWCMQRDSLYHNGDWKLFSAIPSGIVSCMYTNTYVHIQYIQYIQYISPLEPENNSIHSSFRPWLRFTLTQMGLRPQHRLHSLTIYRPLYQLRFSLNKQGADGHLEANQLGCRQQEILESLKTTAWEHANVCIHRCIQKQTHTRARLYQVYISLLTKTEY